MGGNRKHGFMRGAHHVKNWWEKPFFCDGCQKTHGPKVERNKLLDGRLLCNRQYYKELATRQAAFDRQPTITQ